MTVRVRKSPMPFVKIYGSDLFSSSLWEESLETRILFLWFLGTADEDGYVKRHSQESLARLSNMDEAAVVRALAVLEAPDPNSRSPEEEGRRLKLLGDGGWLVVNAKAYREVQTREQALAADRQREHRYRTGKSKRREVQRWDETVGNVAPLHVYEELDDAAPESA